MSLSHPIKTIRYALALVVILAASAQEIQAQINWERMFTGPTTRRIDALGVTARGTVLASAEGRVFRSDDDARSWSVSDAGLFREVGEMMGHPSGTVVAIAQPGGNLGYLFVSEDDGLTWRRSTVESTEKNNFTALAISPDGVLYAGNSQIYVSNTVGLYRSIDGGRSWQPSGLAEHQGIRSILIDTGGIILVAQHQVYSSGQFLSRSTDAGRTWSTIPFEAYHGYFGELHRDSSGGFIARMSRGIMRSDDRGASWSPTVGSWPPLADGLFLSDGRLFASMLAGFMFSSDRGTTWDTIVVTGPEVSMSVVEEITGSGTLVAGSTSGIYRSTDRGRTWDMSSSNMSARFGLPYRFGGAGILVYGWRAVYHSEDLGQWKQAPFEGAVMVDENLDYFIDRFSTLFRSTDRGGRWDSLGRITSGGRMVTNGTGAIFAADHNGGLARSIDTGKSWKRYHLGASHGGAADLKFRGRAGVHATGGTGLATTIDNGETWRYAKRDYSANVAAIAPDLTCYALGEQYRDSGYFRGLFRLPYDDTTWQNISGAQLPGRADSATALFATDDGALFAIWRGRSYRSIDKGMTWSDMSAGLPDDAWGYAITYENELVTLVDGYGVYRWIGGSAAAPGDRSESSASRISNIVPLPANARIRVSFTLSTSADTRIELVDALGHRVAVPIEPRLMAAGEHALDIDVGEYAPGSYLLVLTAGGRRKVGRVVIAR